MTDRTATHPTHPIRRATSSDIARSLGISRTTVAFVLNNTPGQTISSATRDRVLAEAKRVGYRPHTAARALASGRSRLVLLVLPDWPLDFNLRRNIEEASLALDEAGYSLVTYTPHPTGQARPLWEVLQPDVVVGLVPFQPNQIEALRRSGVDTIIPDPDRPLVADYPEEGPSLQIRHLANLGHTRIAYAGAADPRVADLVALRLHRAEEAARELGLPALETLALSLTAESADEAVSTWHRAGITAVAAYNDDIATAILGAALRLGLAVPRDLAVIGHDDTPIAEILQPQLSTIHVEVAGLGRYLAALALSAIDSTPPPTAGPELRATLVARTSTGATTNLDHGSTQLGSSWSGHEVVELQEANKTVRPH